MAHYLVWCSVPDAACGHDLAQQMVTARLAACVSVLPGIRSHYVWQGAVCDSEEALLMIKTTADAWPSLRAWIQAHHPYQVPEIIAQAIDDGHVPYLAWLSEQVQTQHTPNEQT